MQFLFHTLMRTVLRCGVILDKHALLTSLVFDIKKIDMTASKSKPLYANVQNERTQLAHAQSMVQKYSVSIVMTNKEYAG